MNIAQTTQLLLLVGKVKRLEFATGDFEAWALVLADTDYEDAKTVTVAWLRDHPGEWMEAGHVHQGVKALERERLRAYGDIEPPEVEQSGAEWAAWKREMVRKIARGEWARDPATQKGVPAGSRRAIEGRRGA